jgi:hypothetical protein
MTSENNPQTSLYGCADAATDFDRRHPQWREVLNRLVHAIDMSFTRIQVMDTPIDKIAYFYGRLIVEDFMEIFLVAANGYGIAAMKLLRSMYEHTVTLRYLHDYPDEVEDFIDYDAVQQFKLMQPIFETFGTDALPAETIAEVQRKYEEVKEKFMITDCKKCGTKRVNHSWNKLHFAAMAKKTGPIGSLIVPGYFIPLRHAHSTFKAITDRLERREDRLGFQPESQPKAADEALMAAHNCVLVALDVQKERFNIEGLDATLEICVRDWALVWAPEKLHELVNENNNPGGTSKS